MIFVDTSAFYSILDQDDDNHATASERWRRLVADDVELVTSNYILIETTMLLQGRLGMAAAACTRRASRPHLPPTVAGSVWWIV